MDTDLCTWIYHHLSEYLDTELPGSTCEQLEAHVQECTSCRALLHTMKDTVEMVHEFSGKPIPERCLTRLRAKLFAEEGPLS